MLCVLAAVNVIDLARVDGKYLAVEDVSFQKAPNDAAEDVAKAGGGKVFVAIPPQDGGRLVRDSMGVHLAETVDDQAAEGVRFVLASGKSLQADKTLNERWGRGELAPLGFYSLSRQGVRKAAQNAAALVLLQAKNVPAPTDDNFAVMDLQADRLVDPTAFRTRSRNQPFAGMRFSAWPVLTVFNGKVTHDELHDF